MHIIGIIVIGFIVGLIARAIMPGKQIAGIILTTLLGIAGAFIGQYLGQALGLYQADQPAGFFMSVLGAMVLLFILHLFRRSQAEG